MPTAAKTRRPGARPASALARRERAQVSDMQRSRMMSSAVQVVSEMGYAKMSVARVTGRARVSRRTFYDFFEDREDCFLAVFDDVVAQVSEIVIRAYDSASGGGWRAQVRAALTALLAFLEGQPEMASLLVVNTLRAGPRVLQRRAEILERVGGALDDTGTRAKGARAAFAPLTGEGVVGAVFSVIHTRLLAKHPGSLVEMVNPLMSAIVLPYQGPAAAQKELGHSAPELARSSEDGVGSSGISASRSASATDPLAGLPMRLTYRTLRVLAALGEQPGASNREVADAADVTDQGQISKLLGRLERLGLILNTGPGRQPHGEPNAWRLTDLGHEVHEAIELASEQISARRID